MQATSSHKKSTFPSIFSTGSHVRQIRRRNWSTLKCSGEMRGTGQSIPLISIDLICRYFLIFLAPGKSRSYRPQVYETALYLGATCSPYLSPGCHSMDVILGTWRSRRGHFPMPSKRSCPSVWSSAHGLSEPSVSEAKSWSYRERGIEAGGFSL